MPNVYTKFVNCWTTSKTHSTNLEHCFTASITAHSITGLAKSKSL